MIGQLKEKKITHTHTQQHGQRQHTAAAARAERLAAVDPGVSAVVDLASTSARPRVDHGGGTRFATDGVVERLSATRQGRQRRSVFFSTTEHDDSAAPSDQLLTTASVFLRRQTTRVVDFGSGHAHSSHGRKQLSSVDNIQSTSVHTVD